jgi:stearoyl-CoA desaturase (delta-9 desaturase)
MSTLPDSVSHPDETLNFAVLGTWGMQAIHLACLLPLWTGVSWRALIACGVAIVCGEPPSLADFTVVFHTDPSGPAVCSNLSWLGLRHRRCSAARSGGWRTIAGTIGTPTRKWTYIPPWQGVSGGPVGWILCRKHDDADLALVRDLAAFPEIRWLDRHFLVPPLALAVSLTGAGALISSADALQFLVWGFFVSTVLVYHGTFAVNSLAHRFGTRPFDTKDGSRNNLAVAVVMFGEGFHNNHHHCPSSARFSLQPGQIDLGYWLLRLLEWRGLVWDLKAPPAPFQRAKPVRIDPAGRG